MGTRVRKLEQRKNTHGAQNQEIHTDLSLRGGEEKHHGIPSGSETKDGIKKLGEIKGTPPTLGCGCVACRGQEREEFQQNSARISHRICYSLLQREKQVTDTKWEEKEILNVLVGQPCKYAISIWFWCGPSTQRGRFQKKRRERLNEDERRDGDRQ